MNDPLERLEQELRGLTPRRPSAAARQAVATRLRPRRRRGWPLVALTALAASVIVAVLLVRSPPRRPVVADRQPAPAEAAPGEPRLPDGPSANGPARTVVPAGPTPPTLWAFRGAAGGSPEELDMLLAQRDAEQPPVDPHRWASGGPSGSGGLF